MVRLKEAMGVGMSTIYDCFNSNMVRLKDSDNADILHAIKFQFQYGTIKRKQRSKAIVFCLVSIPIWYD